MASIKKKGFIVFDDLSIKEIKITGKSSDHAIYNGKSYKMKKESGYWIIPGMERSHEIYIYSQERKGKCNTKRRDNEKTCPSSSIIKSLNNNSSLPDLYDVERQLRECWASLFELISTCPTPQGYITRINKIANQLKRIQKIIQSKEEGEQEQKVEQEQTTAIRGRAFIVFNNLFVATVYLKSKLPDDSYEVSYHNRIYEMVRTNGYWTIPNIQPNEVYINSPGNASRCRSKYQEYKGICNPVWDITDYTECDSLEELYDVEVQLRECWSTRFEHLWSCKFVPIHIGALNSVANKIKTIQEMIENRREGKSVCSNNSIAFIVFPDLSLKQIRIEEKLNNDSYSVSFGDTHYIMEKEGDYWTIPPLGPNEIYFHEIQDKSVCKGMEESYKGICENILSYNSQTPLSDLYTIEQSLKECWTETFEYLWHCSFDKDLVNRINQIAEEIQSVESLIEKVLSQKRKRVI